MPRSLPVLKAALLSKVWAPTTPNATRAATAQAWADAYGVYALDALGCGTPPGPGQIDAAKARFLPLMEAAMTGVAAPAAANGIQAAFIAWWTGFAFTGTAVVLPGTPTLAPALLGQWGSNPSIGSIDVAVTAHANLIHAWTGTVVTGLPCNAPIL